MRGNTGATSDHPGLVIQFRKGLNLLVGENDSGKSTIIDAIKQVLYTQSFEYIRLDESDFYKPNDSVRATDFKIECKFTDFKDEESANLGINY